MKAPESYRVRWRREAAQSLAKSKDLIQSQAERIKELEAKPVVPDWVADFLNRRTEVEHVLRAPMVARKKGQPEPEPLTAERMWELANKLAVPSEFKLGGAK